MREREGGSERERDALCATDGGGRVQLNKKMCGFYRAKAMLDGKEEYMAVTQHEPTDCRRTMPCFDEPALKATFDVTLIVPSDYTALSNMPVKAEQPLEGGKKEVNL